MKPSKKRFALLLLCSAWMIGAGLRFVLMQSYNTYTYSLFDKFFDWGIMTVLGVTLFLSAIVNYLKEGKTHESNNPLTKK